MQLHDATLHLSVRSNSGQWHLAGEHVKVVGSVGRGEGWDQRRLFSVVFDNGEKGAVFTVELEGETK